MNRLELNLDEPYKVKRESKKEVIDRLTAYSEVYEKATKALQEIQKSFENNKYEQFEYNNNIIAFAGERGSGKTSTMLSFVDSLDRLKYEVLEIFEPNNCEENTDILELFIAKMFLNFKTKMINIKEGDKRELLQLFEKLYGNLRIFNEKKDKFYENEDISNLVNTAEAIKMKKTLAKTVEKYLTIMSDSKDSKILIFMIDDFDLNFAKEYTILEKIRKYLIIPNLIILTCFKKEQMLDEIAMEFFDKNEDPHQKIKKIELAQKYFEKIFPPDRVIDMPKDISLKKLNIKTVMELSEKLNEEMPIENIFTNIFEEKVLKGELSETEKKILVPETIRDVINQLIFLKNLSKENRDSGENLLKYIEQLSLDEELLQEIKKINKLSQKSLLKKNWIKKIEELDEVIEGDSELKDRKRALIKKLYLLNYLNEKLKDFTNCVYNDNFSFIDISNLNSSIIKKEFDGKININILEYIKERLLENDIKEYLILFENNEFCINNILKFLQIDSKVKFQYYYEFIKSLNQNKIKVEEGMSLERLIREIQNALNNFGIESLKEFELFKDMPEEKVKKIEVYTILMMFLNEDISKQLQEVNENKIEKLLEFFSTIPKKIEMMKFFNLEFNLEELEEIILEIEELFITILKLKGFDSSIRKIKKLQEDLIQKEDERIYKKKRNEETIKQNTNKIRENSTKIKKLNSKSKEMQEEYEQPEQAATLKSGLLSLIRRNEDVIQILENENHSLKINNINLELDSSLLINETMSNFHIGIAEEVEKIIDKIFKNFGIKVEEFQIFSNNWISILRELRYE